ncbi:MAG TPA: GerMN domain-containing protein [Terriglobales bacterium]|nr:GerMN domain-containing protein [Terriglobales bacterium]
MNSRPFFVLTCCLCVVALAMSLYVWELRKRAGEDSAPSATPEVVSAPSNATQKQVILWVAQDDSGTLKSLSLSIASSSERQRQAEDILRALLGIYTAKGSPHPLPVGSAVRNVYFVEPGLIVIDVNSELAAGQTSGILAEELTLTSLVQTLNANIQGISRVKFLVDGKEVDTLAGHADLSNVYDVSEFLSLARQLSSQ